MKDISLDVKMNLPIITVDDFDSVKKELEEEIKKYDVVVTSDSLVGAKDVMAKINKVAASIDAKRKEISDAASAPIKNFNDKVKELVVMCKNGRQRIADQVALFEEEKKKDIEVTLSGCLSDLYEDYGVAREFRTAAASSFVKLTAVTAKGSVTAGTINEMTALVRADREREETTTRRLLELEGMSFKGGLDSALTRSHIEHLLFLDDEQFYNGVNRLIEAEFTRQEEAKKAKEETAKKKASVQVGSGKKKPQNGKKGWVVTAVFNIETGDKMTAAKIESQLRDKLIKAGVNVSVNIEVEENS